MARFVRDEKRTYPFMWLAIGGLFAGTAVWAGYAEMTTRVPWQEHQQRFFELDLDLAKRAKKAAEAEWQRASESEPLKGEIAEKHQIEARVGDANSDFGKAKTKLDELDTEFAAAESDKTFGGSDLDEAYYYRNGAEYQRDAKQVEVRKAYKEAFAETEPNRVDDPNRIYADPPQPAVQPGESPEMHHLEVEVERNKAHAEQIDKAIADGPPATVLAALRESRAAELNVASKVQVEEKHQKRVDAAKARMAEIDGPADPVILDKDPKKRDAALKAARESACQSHEQTRNCLKWLILNPVDARLKELTNAVNKAKRPLQDADERLKKAAQRAHPSFDIKDPLAFLIGPYEIKQTVTNWLAVTRDVDTTQVDRCETCHLGIDKPGYAAADIDREFRTHPRRDLLLAMHPIDKYGCTSCHQGQGRATDEVYAHSTWRLAEHWGEERWHFDGDHYWEDPLLSVGKLARIIVDDRNDELEVKVGRNKATVTLEHKVYPDEPAFFAELKGKLQTALKDDAPGYRVICDKLDNRVRIGLEPTAGEPAKKPKSLLLSFTKMDLGKLLGFIGPYGNLAREIEANDLLLVADNPPSLPVRASDDKAQGVFVDTAKAYQYVPPNGAAGLQISDEQRNVFIQALPEVESGCLRCHASDPDLAPQRSRAEYVAAKLAYEKAEVERAHDPAGYAKAHGGDELPKVPLDVSQAHSLAPTLDLGRSLFRKLNCTGCHLLDGFDNNKDAGPQLNDISAKVTPKWLLTWIRYPRGFRAKTSMPDLWPPPLDPASKVPYPQGSPEYAKWKKDRAEETIAIASFLYEKSETAGLSGKPLAPRIKGYADVDGASQELGEKLFKSVGCQGCHANTDGGSSATGSSPGGSSLPAAWRMRERDIAPTLANISAKTNADWIAYWVEDPTRYWHNTSMPALRLTRKQAASIAKYLMTMKSAPSAPAEVSDDEAATVADPKKRAELVECGAAGGVKMSRVDCGEKSIANRGCYGCHRINGFEKLAPIGPELSGFAKKDITTLDFGYALAEHDLQTTETFAVLKLDSPRIFERDRIQLKMGDFDLSAAEIRALVVFLKGTVPATPTEDFNPLKKPAFERRMAGRQLVANLNCRGCHMIEGRGADIDGWRQDLLSQDIQQRAPWLDGEGARTQPEWLFDFLRDPGAHGIRPFLHAEWAYGDDVPEDKLTIRMPTFRRLSAEDWTAIVRYFSTWDNQPYPYQVPKANDIGKDEKLWALSNMNSPQAANCQKCHYYGAFPEQRGRDELAAMAPNIAEMKRRLRPDWVKEWLLRPANYLPYTKMTAFFATASRDKKEAYWPEENDPFLSPPATGWDAAFAGPVLGKPSSKLTSDEQATLLRDFLFSIPDGAPWPKRGEEATSVLVDPDAAAALTLASKEEEGAKEKDKKKGQKEPKPPQHGAIPGPVRF